MKRLLWIVCILMLLLSAAGCVKADAPKVPVTFYYSRIENVNAGENSVIAGEIRDAFEYQDDLKGLLTLYLKGPVSDHLSQTFPKGLQITSLSASENSIEITITDTFLQLGILDANIASAAIIRTVVGLTGQNSVIVHINGYFPADSNTITITAADILLTDSKPTAPTE